MNFIIKKNFRPFNYKTMTDVQAAVMSLLPRLSCSPSSTPLVPLPTDIPGELQQAQDLLVRAKTGTGKTLAFLIPALEGRLRMLESFRENYKLENPNCSNPEANKALSVFAKGSVGVLILSPTRELATQIANEAIALTTHLPQFGVRLLVGGASRGIQLREWTRSPSNDIVVATPGRCVDLLQSESVVRNPVANCRMLILDEADTLLDMGFADDIATVSRHLPDNSDRQTFLFSATVSKQIREVARKSMKKDHIFVDTVGKDDVDTHLHIPQYHTVLPSAEHQILHILRLLAHDQLLHAKASADGTPAIGGKTIIFLPTTRMTQLFSLVVNSMKHHLPWGRDTLLVEIHSKKTQEQRTRASDMFRNASSGYSILVSSDVSARGVDYPGVTRVIQVGVPGSRDLYIHRVGRTGRAGKQGRGDLVLLPWEIGFLSWQLNDLPLKPYPVIQAEKDLASLASDFDSNLDSTSTPSSTSYDRSDKYSSRSSRPPRTINAPVTPRLSTLSESLTTNVLPTIDDLSIRETFASLLGYYITKAHELRTTKEVVVEGLKDWAMKSMGLPEAPYVSDMFLRKMGMNDGRTKNRGKPRDGYKGFSERDGGGGGGYGASRGGYGDRNDRGSSRGGDRGGYGSREQSSYGGDRSSGGGDREVRSYGDRNSGGDRETRSYGGDRNRDSTPSSRSSYGGASSIYGSSSADSWEKSSSGGNGGEGRGRRSY